MRDGRRLIANIGSLLAGSAAERERLAAAGAAVVEGRGGTEDDLVASCADAEVVMGLGQFPFTERVFESLPRLEFLMQCTVGYDRVDVGAATRQGVLVANSPLFCIEEVSDHAVMLLMACARKLPHQVHANRRHGWSRPPAVEAMGSVQRMRGQTLGFVGFGKIARLTAEKLCGLPDALPGPRSVSHGRDRPALGRRARLARRAVPPIGLHLHARAPQRGAPGACSERPSSRP